MEAAISGGYAFGALGQLCVSGFSAACQLVLNYPVTSTTTAVVLLATGYFLDNPCRRPHPPLAPVVTPPAPAPAPPVLDDVRLNDIIYPPEGAPALAEPIDINSLSDYRKELVNYFVWTVHGRPQGEDDFGRWHHNDDCLILAHGDIRERSITGPEKVQMIARYVISNYPVNRS